MARITQGTHFAANVCNNVHTGRLECGCINVRPMRLNARPCRQGSQKKMWCWNLNIKIIYHQGQQVLFSNLFGAVLFGTAKPICVPWQISLLPLTNGLASVQESLVKGQRLRSLSFFHWTQLALLLKRNPAYVGWIHWSQSFTLPLHLRQPNGPLAGGLP